jgi:Tfp pilus assembly protein PilF
VSRRGAVWLMALLASVWLGGCGARLTEVQRLQARATYERGLAHLERKEAALALSAIQEAIAIDDSVPVYWNALGWLYLQLGRPDLALGPFARATQLDESYAEAQANAGIALAEMARWEEAVAAYRKALSLPTLPTPHTAYQNLGVALYNLKRYREAEEALRFAISLEPTLDAAYYHLGLVYLAGERRDDAKLAFRRARDLAPQSPFGQAAVGQLRALGEGG